MSENSELEKEKSALALSTDDSDIHGSNDWEVHADMPDMADCEAPHLDSTVKQRSGGSDFAEAECDSATDNSATLASKQETKEEPTIVEDGARPWDFSSRKVMVQGVNKFHDVKTLTKIVNKWLEDIKSTTDVSLAYDKIKKPPKETWMVVTMQAEAMVQPFIDYICTNEIQNKRGGKLFAKLALNESRDNDNRGKRTSRDDHGDEDQTSKRQRVQHARRPITDEELKNKITPLWKLSPEEQLDTKMKEMIKKCAMKIMNEIKIKFRKLGQEKSRSKLDIFPWVLQKRAVDMQPIVAAPTPLRNKCEFTFGYQYLFDDDKETNSHEVEKEENGDTISEPRKVPAIGFMVTGWAGGVSFSDTLSNIPSEAGAVVSIVNSFLSTSPLIPYDSKAHQGFWRILTMRTSRRTQECMIIIQHSPAASGGQGDAVSYNFTKEFETERVRLVSLLTEADLPSGPGEQPLKVTSIFFQEFGGLSNPTPEHPVQHAFGNTFLTEKLGKCTFQISPGAFFQVNTEGAEILYQLAVNKIREVSKYPEKTLLFDVCCGTGTIGLTCMKEGVVGQVIGVDISLPAIEDAKKNAVVNGFDTSQDDSDSKSNTRFIAARAEQVLGREISKVKHMDMNFVAVVDPAREGLHADVVKAIRSNEKIGRLVYVSCNPTASLVRDAVLLCGPTTKRYVGRPFRITSATPVDMFPLTDHCELVMTFDRLTDAE